ncbi:uncharacterized protein LOC143280502 [Babylonia areolata]|uniref:uncharacterized protein LOC143280502 n=1 Tax=Babylonia areolata TaxID=304850 RepID=UPI003FD34E6E
MSCKENSEVQHGCSEPKPIPKEPALTIDNMAQCASFVSQRSSSIDTFGSDSQADELVTDSAVQGDASASSSAGGTAQEKNNEEAGEEGVTAGGEGNGGSQRWMCNDEAMPASMLHPSHQSTPVMKNNQYLPPGTHGGGGVGAEDVGDEEEIEENDDGRPSREIFFPGDLQTPITGFETMEARSKFTVYKIQVQKTASEAGLEPAIWFIFRRYSDFLHLNERLKHLFPGFRLSLPPKRWFRDNFDSNFLEDRMLGLQAFLDNITGHKDICNSEPVRAFFCTDEPPGPHDSLEESRALCDTLEESMYSLRQEIQDKDAELSLLKEEVSLYKSQVEMLSSRLKAITGIAPSVTAGKGASVTPTSPTPVSSGSNRSSLAECEILTPDPAGSDEVKSQPPEAQDSQ